MDLGLCLAGGGIKGASHIGCIKAFEEEGIVFDYVSGTSSGSIVACLYALGYTSDEMLDIFKQYCHKIKYIDFKTIAKLIGSLAIKHKFSIMGLNSGTVIRKLVTRFANEKNIQNIKEIKIPLIIPSSVIFENDISDNCCDNLIDVLHTSIDLLCHELSTYELQDADFLIKIHTENISLLDCSKIDYLYKVGYDKTKQMLKDNKLAVRNLLF